MSAKPDDSPRPTIARPGLTVYQGDALRVLRSLPSESVHCCVTSPPYMGLRRYLDPSDPDAALEVGQEQTPALFVARLVDIFREVRRVLRSDGTCWVNMGDSYAASPGKGDNVPQTKWGVHGYPTGAAHRTGAAGIPAKNLLLIPQRLAISLQDDGWVVRSIIIWSKGSCMPESVRDRPTTSHEYVLMLTKSERYFYDALAVAEPVVKGSAGSTFTDGKTGVAGMGRVSDLPRAEAATRNVRTVWEINSQPFSAAKLGVTTAEHFAVYPPELVRRVLACATSERGCCAACGAPFARVVERKATRFNAKEGAAQRLRCAGAIGGGTERVTLGMTQFVERTEHGWAATCSCDDPRPPVPATVLDCFLGSGTTAKQATKMGRACVGIELSASYLDIIEQRTAQTGIDMWDGEAS